MEGWKNECRSQAYKRLQALCAVWTHTRGCRASFVFFLAGRPTARQTALRAPAASTAHAQSLYVLYLSWTVWTTRCAELSLTEEKRNSPRPRRQQLLHTFCQPCQTTSFVTLLFFRGWPWLYVRGSKKQQVWKHEITVIQLFEKDLNRTLNWSTSKKM